MQRRRKSCHLCGNIRKSQASPLFPSQPLTSPLGLLLQSLSAPLLPHLLREARGQSRGGVLPAGLSRLSRSLLLRQEESLLPQRPPLLPEVVSSMTAFRAGRSHDKHFSPTQKNYKLAVDAMQLAVEVLSSDPHPATPPSLEVESKERDPVPPRPEPRAVDRREVVLDSADSLARCTCAYGRQLVGYLRFMVFSTYRIITSALHYCMV